MLGCGTCHREGKGNSGTWSKQAERWGLRGMQGKGSLLNLRRAGVFVVVVVSSSAGEMLNGVAGR